MTIRNGMSGGAVKQIQELLAAQKLYLGQIDSSFGGGVESAVKNFQKAQGLPPSGLVDAATWGKMFPGVPPPASEISTHPLSYRCLALTGSFETSQYPPACFWGITGDFDDMGISYGALQWNVGQGSLQPLLKDMFDQHPAIAQNVFHEHFGTLQSLRTASISEQLAFSRSIQHRFALQEPWQGMLIALGRTPEYQNVQVAHANRIFQQALNMCADYGLLSERAVALMFDIATQGGSIGPIVRSQIMADFSQLPAGNESGEVAKMIIVANRRAAASNPKFVDDVRTRKLAVANGTGKVHGVFYDLADMFGITLNPFAKGLAAMV